MLARYAHDHSLHGRIYAEGPSSAIEAALLISNLEEVDVFRESSIGTIDVSVELVPGDPNAGFQVLSVDTDYIKFFGFEKQDTYASTKSFYKRHNGSVGDIVEMDFENGIIKIFIRKN